MINLNSEKIIIEIDPEDETYRADISFCNVERLKGVLIDLLDRIETGRIYEQVEVYHGDQ
jgi:hypothetical protein